MLGSMNSKLVVALTTLSIVWVFFSFSLSQDPYVARLLNLTFDMDSKFEVMPGQTLVVNGKLFNTGYLWVYDLNLSVENLPDGFTASIEPNYTKVFKRLYTFPEGPRGIPKPLNFTLTVKVPENLTKLIYDFNITASGVFKRYIPDEMKYRIFGSVERYQRIVLKVLPQPRFNVTDIEIPEEVITGEPFNISMIVTNYGNVAETANISVDVPVNWTVEEKTKSVHLDAGENTTVLFTIIPGNTSGNVSILWSYPFNATIINFTQVGPYLVPSPAIAPPIIKLPFELTIAHLIVIVSVVIVIIFLAYTLTRYKIRIRTKPEEMKKTRVVEEKVKENLSELLC